MNILSKMLGKEDKSKIETKIQYYNIEWLEGIADRNNFIISENTDKVNNILSALNKRNGQCPCGGNTPQFQCPCIMMREHGHCKCGLFAMVKPREIKGNTTSAVINNE